MALLTNNGAFRENVAGVPREHAHAFRTVAASQRCVILVRCVGPTCLQLLQQGYDTKGFRIHGKSCDWGPMAGFVLRDPRLNKNGMEKAGYNRGEHVEALSDARSRADWTASTTPLRLFPERVEWLRTTGRIALTPKAGRLEGHAVHPSGIAFHYCLIKVQTPAGEMWGVYFDRSKNAPQLGGARGTSFMQEHGGSVARYDTKYGDMYEPMLAMTNSVDHRHYGGEHPLNAITGDYDLFALWPFLRGPNRYDRHGEDRRILGTVKAWSQRDHIEHVLERNFTVPDPERNGVQHGTKLGNMTNRLYSVSQILNSTIGGMRTGVAGMAGQPFPRRNVLWHSDEAARPHVADVDLPLIAFTPGGNHIAIETIADFRTFVQLCLLVGIVPTLAEGWAMNPDPHNADPKKRYPNRLGAAFAPLVPPDWNGGQWLVPIWYNA
jgi:hypothetical protein